MRQTIRKSVVFISFLTFPIVIYYFSPVVIIMGAFKGIAAGSFITFSVMFLLSLFLGRAICGWYCPAGGLQECAKAASDKPAKNGKLNWIKYFIWVPWLGVIIILFVKAGGINSVDVFYQTNNGISVSSTMSYIVFYGFTGLIVLLSFTAGRRAFCHYVCWMAPFMILGDKIRNLLKLPSLRLKAQKENCIDCKRCNKECQMSLDVNTMVQNEDMAHSECILCGACADVCNKKCIQYSL
ncbi:MAG: 4Fe-4S binding protein [bacterium]|nr:4Fe-4S binding protein [bacterium]